MSSKKTEHLQLHLWERTDEFRREEFVENFDKVDAGVKAAEDRAAGALNAYKAGNDKAVADGLGAQAAALNTYRTANDAAVGALAAAMPHMAVGSYVGTGGLGAGAPNTLTFDFAPKLVVIVAEKADAMKHGTVLVTGQTISSGIAVASQSNTTLKLYVSWSGNSVSWYSAGSYDEHQLNQAGVPYFYFAIG